MKLVNRASRSPFAARWGRRLSWLMLSLLGMAVAAALLFYGYHWIENLFYEQRVMTVRSRRPELGGIRLVPARSDGGIPGWVAHFQLDVPMQEAWRSLSRCGELAKALKGVASCRTLEKGPGWEINLMQLTHAKGMFLKHKTWYEPKRYRSHWKMLDGSFQAAAGYVRLEPLPGHPGWCKVAYAYFLKISPLLPRSFERKRNRRSARNMADDIQRYFTKRRRGFGEVRIAAPAGAAR